MSHHVTSNFPPTKDTSDDLARKPHDFPSVAVTAVGQ